MSSRRISSTSQQNVRNSIVGKPQELPVTVVIRSQSECTAMSDVERAKLRIYLFVHAFCRRFSKVKRQQTFDPDSSNHDDAHDNDDSSSDEESLLPVQHYRVRKLRKGKRRTRRMLLLSLITCCFTDLLQSDGDGGFHLGPRRCLVKTVHWTSRVSVVPLFLLMCFNFYVWTLLFAGLIFLVARSHPQCIDLDRGHYQDVSRQFFDAYSLSWNTFSTTGYGAVSPAASSEHTDRLRCHLFTIVCSMESFLGVLYVGFCAAILFGKVLRLHKSAQVQFSDPLLIKFGSGVVDDPSPYYNDTKVNAVDETQRTTTTSAEEETLPNMRMPLPVLEFRVINRMSSENGGEVIASNLNVVACICVQENDPLSMETWKIGDRSKPSMASASRTELSRKFKSEGDLDEVDTSFSEHYSFSFSYPNFVRSIFKQSSFSVGTDHPCEAEVDPSRNVGKHIYIKVNIEASSHPFFRRVWMARHILDETSPILKPNIRRKIHRLGGSWPTHLNTHDAVRACLNFHQILVSFTGVANISASTVYAQKIYEYGDLVVGYQFVNMIYKDSEGDLQLWPHLINVVKEQDGGGGEPLMPA